MCPRIFGQSSILAVRAFHPQGAVSDSVKGWDTVVDSWMVGWLKGHMIRWLIGWLVGEWDNWMAGCFVACIIVWWYLWFLWMVGYLVRLAGRMVGWKDGRVVGGKIWKTRWRDRMDFSCLTFWQAIKLGRGPLWRLTIICQIEIWTGEMMYCIECRYI